jgi:hypothetical protein
MRRGGWLPGLCVLWGCTYVVRTPADYRADVRAALESKQDELARCYAWEREHDARASGGVLVQFEVEADTGLFVAPAIAPVGSSAGEGLQVCVLELLESAILLPPDDRTGRASFQFEFTR